MRRLGLAAMAAVLPACSQVTTTPTVVAPAEVSVTAAPTAAQTLYRVRYDGPEGDGSLRLVKRQVAADRFQLQAADTFGRAVWSLDLDGREVLLVDHRRGEACASSGDLRVPEVALRPLPLTAVARVLDARTPLEAPPGVDRADWTDDDGRRWTSRTEDGLLAAWTLWQSGEPQLWWTRQPRGGVLSHRDGSQFRWRQTAREDLPPASYRRIEAPAEYRFGECRAGEVVEPATGDPAG